MKKFLQSKDSKKLRVLIAFCGLVLSGFTAIKLLAPVAVTDPATAIAPTSAVLNGTVTPDATNDTDVSFSWGTDPTLTVSTNDPSDQGTLTAGGGPTPVTFTVTILAETQYYFRVEADDGLNPVENGSIQDQLHPACAK